MKTPFFWLTWMSKRNGCIDGKKGIPALEQQEHPFYEHRLKEGAETSIRHLAEEWRSDDRKLKEEYCRLLMAHKNATARIKTIQPDYQELLEDKDDLDDTWQKTHSVPWTYRALFAFLAACEFPMNSVVFDILGEAKWLTYILAAGLGVVIPLAAHYVGIKLRRESPLEHWRAALKTGLIVIVVFAVLIGLAYLRERYVAGSGMAAVLGIEMDPRMVTLVFLSINLLIFVVAVIASYMVHMDVTDAQIRSSHITQRSLKEIEELLKDVKGNLDQLKKKCDEIREEYSKLAVSRNKLFEIYRDRSEICRHSCEYLMNVYRTSNMRARAESSTQIPICFKNVLTIDTCPFDGELDEECEPEIEAQVTGQAV